MMRKEYRATYTKDVPNLRLVLTRDVPGFGEAGHTFKPNRKYCSYFHASSADGRIFKIHHSFVEVVK